MQKSIATSLILTLGSVVLWMGCSTGVPAPEWYPDVSHKVSGDAIYIYASATAGSTEEQMAIDKAKHDARVRIARQLDARIQKFLEETGDSEKAAAISGNAGSEIILRGSKVSKQEIKRDGSVYHAYVLMKMPVQEADRALVEKVKANSDLYARLIAGSEGFRRLEKEVAEYKRQK